MKVIHRPVIANTKSLKIAKLLKLCVIAIALTMFYPAARMTETGPWLMPLNLERAGYPYLLEFLALLSIGLFILGLLKGEFHIYQRYLSLVCYGLLAWSAFIIIGSFYNPIGEINLAGASQARLFIIGLVFFMVVCNVPWELKDIKRFLLLFWIIMLFHATFIFLIPFVPWFRPLPGLPVVMLGPEWNTSLRVAGYWPAFSLAGLMIAIAWISMFLVLSRQSNNIDPKLRLLVLIVISIISLNGILMTGTRSALLTVLSCLLMIFLRSHRHLNRTLIKVMIGIVPIIFIYLMFSGAADTMLERSTEKTVSSEMRGRILVDAFDVASSYPLGVGFGGFESAYQNIYQTKTISSGHSQNSFIGILIALGVPGFILIVGLIAYILRYIPRALLEKQNDEASVYLRALQYGIIVWVIVGLFEELFWEPSAMIIFWLMAAFALSLSAQIKRNARLAILR
jgi:O-antigen ligase